MTYTRSMAKRTRAAGHSRQRRLPRPHRHELPRYLLEARRPRRDRGQHAAAPRRPSRRGRRHDRLSRVAGGELPRRRLPRHQRRTGLLLMRRLAPIVVAAPCSRAARRQTRERTDAPPLEPYKIILVGDSTMAPHSGWGRGLLRASRQIVGRVPGMPGAAGAAHAAIGRRAAGTSRLAEAKVPGWSRTWVLIQFAHNDQSSKSNAGPTKRPSFPRISAVSSKR